MNVLLVWLGVLALCGYCGYLGYKLGPVALPAGVALGFLYGHFVLSAVM